jgi:hypothetical protein
MTIFDRQNFYDLNYMPLYIICVFQKSPPKKRFINMKNFSLTFSENKIPSIHVVVETVSCNFSHILIVLLVLLQYT